MSIDHTSRIEGVVKGALKEAALGEPFGYHLSFGYWPAQDQNGQVMGAGPAWFLCVTIRNGLAREPIANGAPLHGLLPPDEAFAALSRRLIETARAAREQAEAQDMAAAKALGDMKGRSLKGLVG